MAKYRIKKNVAYSPEYGDVMPTAYYTIEQKILWWWYKIPKVLGSKTYTFRTLDEAEKALGIHIKFLSMLASDESIVKEINI